MEDSKLYSIIMVEYFIHLIDIWVKINLLVIQRSILWNINIIKYIILI